MLPPRWVNSAGCDVGKGLTAKQARFVDEYLIDLNATQAAIRAGYSVRSARQQAAENMAKPVIRDALASIAASRRAEVALSASEVLGGLRTEATYHGDGASHGARVSSWGLLGKHLHLFDEKITFDGTLTIEVVRFGDDEPKVIEHED